ASWDIVGTLILTVGGTATTAGTPVVVTIELDNSATAQAAATPTVNATLEAGDVDGAISSTPMTFPGTDLLGVTAGESLTGSPSQGHAFL
ncbi:hypothetical protein T484DRAFT_1849021, partial [Baffinella frigidus]